MLWSPWVLQDRAREYEAAWQVVGQWRPVEPDGHPQAVEEASAAPALWLAEADARFEAEERQAERNRADRAASHDPQRAQARLALLEERAMLANRVAERAHIRSAGWRSEKQHQAQAAKIEREIVTREQEVERLALSWVMRRRSLTGKAGCPRRGVSWRWPCLSLAGLRRCASCVPVSPPGGRA